MLYVDNRFKGNAPILTLRLVKNILNKYVGKT